MAIKLEVFSLARDFLSRSTEGIDLYTSAKFCGFNTNLNNYARCRTIFLYYLSLIIFRIYII